jgi:hypothetical protein
MRLSKSPGCAPLSPYSSAAGDLVDVQPFAPAELSIAKTHPCRRMEAQSGTRRHTTNEVSETRARGAGLRASERLQKFHPVLESDGPRGRLGGTSGAAVNKDGRLLRLSVGADLHDGNVGHKDCAQLDDVGR